MEGGNGHFVVANPMYDENFQPEFQQFEEDFMWNAKLDQHFSSCQNIQVTYQNVSDVLFLEPALSL